MREEYSLDYLSPSRKGLDQEYSLDHLSPSRKGLDYRRSIV